MERIFRHPLFLAGFRPFFTLAFVAGVVLPLVWVLVYSGQLSLPSSALSPLQWHVHEMLFGFGWAVLGGFLLTASKNWVQIRGLHGAPLAAAALFWGIERLAVLTAGSLPSWLRWFLLNAFLIFVASYVVWSLVRYRKQDSFRDNYFFLLALPLFLVAKNLLLSPGTYVIGWTMALGLFRVAFVVMFERTFPPFMKGAAKIELLRNRPLDFSIKALMLTGVFEALLPLPIATGVLIAAATLLAVRFLLWKPTIGLASFPVGVMYIGYLGLIAHLTLEVLRLQGIYVGIGSVATHVFVFFCLGVVVPAMLIRICQGHTGRSLVFTRSDRAGMLLLGAGGFFRVVATQLWPAYYPTWITLAAVGWMSCFVMLGFRLVPFLWRPRVDGREH